MKLGHARRINMRRCHRAAPGGNACASTTVNLMESDEYFITRHACGVQVSLGTRSMASNKEAGAHGASTTRTSATLRSTAQAMGGWSPISIRSIQWWLRRCQLARISNRGDRCLGLGTAIACVPRVAPFSPPTPLAAQPRVRRSVVSFATAGAETPAGCSEGYELVLSGMRRRAGAASGDSVPNLSIRWLQRSWDRQDCGVSLVVGVVPEFAGR
jgi:hypothetical protein